MIDKVHIPEDIRRHPAVWKSRAKRCWPVCIWLGAIALGTVLYFHGGQFGGMSGTVEVIREEIAPLETARLLALKVQPGQHIKTGDAVAEMDASVLDAEMAVERLQMDRQFGEAVSRAEADLRDAKTRQAETKGELEVLDAEVKRMDVLLAKQLIDAQTVARTRARQKALTEAVAFYPETIRRLEEDLARTRQRLRELDAKMDGQRAGAAGEGGPETDRLGLLELRRQSYTLRSSTDGVVSRVNNEVGDVVQAGAAVVEVVADEVRRIIGFLPEYNARAVKEGMTAYVTRSTGGGAVVEARVVAMVPEIVALPTRVNPVPSQTLRGRRVLLVPTGPADFLPGEGVAIHFERPLLTALADLLGWGKKPAQAAKEP